jgi:hypothetical protein
VPLTRRRIDDPIERRIVTGMVVSDRFLQEVQAFYRPHLLGDPSARLLAGWCLDYWAQYRSAPGPHVRDLFESHARNGLGDAEAEAISSILAAASEEHERADHFNADYLLDEAERHLKGRSLLALAEDLKAALASPAGGPVEAERVLEEYHRVERPKSAGTDPFTDRDGIRRAFAPDAQQLFKVPGVLGQLIRKELIREGFVAFLGPPKRGKSFLLMELALIALRQRCNVAHFECGDLGEKKWYRRLHTRISHKPYRHYDPKYQGTQNLPVLDCERNQGDRCDRDRDRSWGGGSPVVLGQSGEPERVPSGYKPCASERCPGWVPAVWRERIEVLDLDEREAFRNGRFFSKRVMEGRRFKLSCHPKKTLTVSQIRTQLDLWERLEGFVPDVISIDYLRILAPERNGPKETRLQMEDRWAMLGSLSQERHCLVLTADQSDADGMTRETLNERNFGETMMAMAHVRAMYGLNRTPAEKRQGLMRFNEIVVGEDDNEGKTVTVLQALHVGRPLLGSFWTPAKKSEGEAKKD